MGTFIWGPNPVNGDQSLLSPLFSVFTPKINRGLYCFLFLLPAAWITGGAISLRRNQGLLQLIKETFPSPVVLYSSFPSASL